MRRIDELDYVTIDGVRCCKGHVLPFGASLVASGGINFSVSSADATAAELVLYHAGAPHPYARIPLTDRFRTGDSFSVIVYDQDIEELEYTYRFKGPYDPERGLLFDSTRDLLDPYAKLVCGRDVWGRDERDIHPLRGKVIFEDYDWEGDRQLETPLEDLVIYELHVRGFTRDEASGVARRATYTGVAEKVGYLRRLGVNCVELLPVFEFDELEYLSWPGGRTHNFWGYSTVAFFAPKAAYAGTGRFGMACDELKNMVKRLHRAGISVILDVVFNHTAEGDEHGRTISYRGIDNRTYYHLDDHGRCLNYSGCGNTVNCNNAIVRQHILDCLRYWVSDYHIDGFRFDEASILSRDVDGSPMDNPPLIEALAHDPILAKTILIAEPWDAAGLYQVGDFPAGRNWSEWNGKFRDCVRHFIKSDAWAGPELLQRIQGSPDMFWGREHPTINFVTCHDGFTLNDLVSFNEKHNEANGEGNRDGSNDNLSWNCGCEGDTDDPAVESLRNRQVKNALALLMLSRGTPMMLAGDEFRNSQGGNNNAYCQDNPTSWVMWEGLRHHADVFEFCRQMIALRRTHPVIGGRGFLTGTNETGYPELSFHGETPWYLDMEGPFHTFGFMYAEPASIAPEGEEAFVYCGVNAYWEGRTLGLPRLPDGLSWHLVAYSADTDHTHHERVEGDFHLCPRSLVVLSSVPEPE